MRKAIMTVLTNPVSPDRRDEFDDWYTNAHVPDMVAIDGVAGATRYMISDVQIPPTDDPPPYRYLCIYELESDDLEKTRELMIATAVEGRIRQSDSLHPDVFSWTFEPITERITHAPEPARAEPPRMT